MSNDGSAKVGLSLKSPLAEMWNGGKFNKQNDAVSNRNRFNDSASLAR